MEIGFHLPTAQPGATAEGIVEVARAIERLGFDAGWMFDHLLTPTALSSAYPYSRDGSYAFTANDPFFDPLAVFGYVLGAVPRIKLGSGVLVGAYRHPIVLGKALASIERFAPGRLVVGIGSGWMREEFDAVGVPFEGRGARLEEYVAALRAVWSGEPRAFEGERYRWAEAGFLPAPTRPIPILVGGHSDAALARAARVGDGWAIVTGKGHGSGLSAIEARLGVLRGELARAGREGAPFELLSQQALVFADAPNPKLPLMGPCDAIAASLERLRELGVTMIDLVVFGPPSMLIETAARFAEEVLPLVGRARP